MLPVGTSIVEGVASGTTPLLDTDKYNVGLIGEFERGVLNVATRSTTLQENRKINGGLFGTAYSPYVVRNLFKNAGRFGAVVYTTRVAGAATTAASAAASFTPTGTPAWVTTPIVTGTATQKASSSYRPTHVNKGDTFTIAGVSYVTTNCNPTDVVKNLTVQLNANSTFATNYVATDQNTAILITQKAFSTPVNPVAAVTAFTYVAVNLGTAKAGQLGKDDPGVWANNNVQLNFLPYGTAGVGLFGLNVYFKGSLVETWTDGTPDGVIAALNSSSYYATFSNLAAGQWPTDAFSVVLSGGTYAAPANEAAYYPIPSATTPSGLACFDGVSVQILLAPEYNTMTMALQGRDYAYSSNRIFVTALPQNASDATVQTFSAALQTMNIISSSIAGYNTWVRTTDENGGYTWVPGTGCIVGAGYLRVPQQNRDQVWIAPAGTESVYVDVIEIAPAVYSQGTIDLYVHSYTTNVSVSPVGTGPYTKTSRTMSTNDLFMSVHIRRFANYLVDFLPKQVEFAEQKGNSPELRTQLVNLLTRIGKGFYDDGGLERSLPFAQAWQVICDASNNPPGQNRKELNIDILWVPSEVIESIQIRLNRNDGIITATIIEPAQAA